MLEPAARLKVISRIKTIVVRHHFNIGNVDYSDWSRAVDERIPTLLPADNNVFEEGIRSLLCQLKSSHTKFYRSDANSTMPQYVIGATLRSVPGIGALRWMFLDVFDDSPAACADISPGHLLVAVNGTPAAPPSFPVFRFGQEHHVTVELPNEKETRNVVVTVPPRTRKRATTATRRAEKHQLPHVTEHWNIEDSVLSGGVWNSLLKTSRRCGSVTQSTRLRPSHH